MNKNLKWTNEKRSMALIKKAKRNDVVKALFEKYMVIIYGVYRDRELVTETYMRLTNEYNENQDFMQQFHALYRKLKLIKLIDNQKAAATWIPLLEAQIKKDDGNDDEYDGLEN